MMGVLLLPLANLSLLNRFPFIVCTLSLNKPDSIGPSPGQRMSQKGVSWGSILSYRLS